jgi:hypothetical protein
VLQGFAAPSNTSIEFYFFRFSGSKMFLKESGVPLKIKNNAQHHNTKQIPIIRAWFRPLLIFAGQYL